MKETLKALLIGLSPICPTSVHNTTACAKQIYEKKRPFEESNIDIYTRIIILEKSHNVT